jgi:hypothetical protein
LFEVLKYHWHAESCRCIPDCCAVHFSLAIVTEVKMTRVRGARSPRRDALKVPTAEQWRNAKPAIENLYIQQGLSLQQVMVKMEQQGFIARLVMLTKPSVEPLLIEKAGECIRPDLLHGVFARTSQEKIGRFLR